MSTEIAKTYDASAAQNYWVRHWLEQGYCNAEPDPNREQHTIMIPLPNVTGALHMGHCLNGTVQDLLTRWRRMQGRSALWMPGTDHAGIATQAVVERRMLEEEGLTRHDIGREALVDRIWKWKDEYEARILNQLQQIGSSCDWRRVRFTLDEVCSAAVRRTFFRMFSDGLIYRGKRLVNWDTYLQTAVADDEVFHEDVAGSFWTMHYPVVDADGNLTGEKISFSTTRPETMLGDTAVCVHPSDERYANVVGRKVLIPVLGRAIPVIADALLADKDLGTGAVKVTPAHDPNDYACALRNDLPMINILNPDGTINENGADFAGMTCSEARQAVVARMDELGHLEKVEDRVIPLMHSDRSKTPIEPYLSDQWFVQMDQLAQSAMDAVEDGRVRFFPNRYTKTYLDWLSEKRDWCISRQLWWGHRIPVWSVVAGEGSERLTALQAFGATIADDETIVLPDEYAGRLAARFAPGLQTGEELILVCVDGGNEELEQSLCEAGFVQDEDVLDTWFSSALWPHATLGWPNLDRNPPVAGESSAERQSPNQVLPYFYPGSVLVTSRDIITLWVARMVLTGLYNMGDVPFGHVYIHPKILDGLGQTMSKSRGNGVDPLELVDKYGTDAVRFTIASLCGETQDVRLPVGYECPHCEAVTPQTKEHQEMRPMGGPNPSIRCGKCKEEFQFPSPWFTPDEGAAVARIVSERFDYGRNFCNKLWNACRFAFMNLEGYEAASVSDADLTMEDRWILSRLATTIRDVTVMLERYQFDQATRAVREFTWNEFCDWYLEMLKPRFRNEQARPGAQRVLVVVVDNLLRMLHPFAPFITEELWHKLNEVAPERGLRNPATHSESVMIASWPDPELAHIDEALERRFERLQQTIAAVRNVRAVYRIAPGAQLRLFMRCEPEVAEQLQAVAEQFDFLSKTMLEAAGVDISRPAGAASFSLGDADGYIPLEGLIDREAEIARQTKEAAKLKKFIAGHQGKLNNKGFMENAPERVIAEIRETLAGLQSQLDSVERILEELG
jgi:valyl-tRNA synthetase